MGVQGYEERAPAAATTEASQDVGLAGASLAQEQRHPATVIGLIRFEQPREGLGGGGVQPGRVAFEGDVVPGAAGEAVCEGVVPGGVSQGRPSLLEGVGLGLGLFGLLFLSGLGFGLCPRVRDGLRRGAVVRGF